MVVTTTSVSVNTTDDVIRDEPDFGLLPDTQKLVGCLLDAAEAAQTNDDEDILDNDNDNDNDNNEGHEETYFNACKWLE